MSDQPANPNTDAKPHQPEAGQPSRRGAIGAIVGALAAVGAAGSLSASPRPEAMAAETGTPELDALDRLTVKPTNLSMQPRVTYLGGPTFLIEIGRFRLVTDPGFDPGTERNEGPATSSPRSWPHRSPSIGLALWTRCCSATPSTSTTSTTRAPPARVGTTITTPASAEMKLPGKKVKGLATWASTEITNAAGERLKITAMPAVHTSNPALREAVGEVTGFMLEWQGARAETFYISGDTVWIDEMNEIARRYKVNAAILHLGAANVPAVGDNFLTMSSAEGVRLAQTLGLKEVYPAHFEGWRHWRELVHCPGSSRRPD
ncbi:MAG: MBL fold metallo-hydrolase [Gemmatimonadetes bacterium]|nr:MBL fold metallo-hydrolase [Gemmatimonadota bacterium]